MSGLPGQNLHALVDTLNKVGELSPEHVSVYSLQVEEGTPLSEREDLINMIPNEDQDREMYVMTKKVLKTFGYKRYEFSNYAKPGYESRHNSVYWTGGQYIGFGIGAASFFKGQRFTNIKNIDSYIEICEDIRDELTRDTDRNRVYDHASMVLRENVETMYVDKRMEEFMFLGLRMTAGVSREEFKTRFNRDMFDIYGEVINKYTDQGFISVDDKRVRLTEKGIDVSNYILADFILDK
jgi:oxygen-independent coproporphyrinogen-3 oxidase